MDVLTIALLLGAAGVGGVVGVAAAAVLAGSRVQAAFAEFEEVFTAHFKAREDPDGLRVRTAFASLKDSLAALSGAFERLKRALRIR